ncbi:PREDICTED: BTB and MATH domain-containing protein 36-like [Acropora digitifera]|uniref:BTB and MATH domain-containing protein 36-like n=1 Tax=Acropora digitifera TaxID=70779 RepID=UPI00077A4F9C|nr:PREDICTED: BTB and MATH domain-containing protein 36-like [Acropora digitifera]
MAAASYPPHFAEPWKLSDVVLVVEDQRFHVHRGTLAFWSPVFEKMFSTEFKEKNNDEILLPGKKASEFEEMLRIMYPSLEEKLVTKINCYFLFELAHEYQIEDIIQKCVNLMVSMVKDRRENDVLRMLIYAQKYQIKSLISTCIFEARRLTLKELTQHGMRDQIEADNYVQIAEGIIQRLEEKCRDMKVTLQSQMTNVCRSLFNHRGSSSSGLAQPPPTTKGFLDKLQYEGVYNRSLQCQSLSDVAIQLSGMNAQIESLTSP